MVRIEKSEYIRLAHEAAGHPTEGMCFVGVTGTNGKSTVADGLAFLLNRLGQAFGLFGTVRYSFGDKVWPATHTTPDLPGFLRVLGEMKSAGAKGIAIEVSSHALDQDRILGTRFEGAIFTNLTQDHLDYHQTMENYFAAKAKLFSPAYLAEDGFSIFNIDDPYGRKLAASHTRRSLTYGVESPDADCRVLAASYSLQGMVSRIQTPMGSREFKSPLIGEHNLSNLLAMLAAALAMGFPLDEILSHLSAYHGVSGRLERVTPLHHPFSVFVDYAHTPDALAHVLRCLRALVPPPGKLSILFGCGGDRDRGKRPLMGAEAARYADEIWLSSDNPRSESPEAIIDDILNGIPEKERPQISREVDRRVAIQRAVSRLSSGDLLLVAGKGHEDIQVIGEEKLRFNDVEEVKACLV